jgi:hypothetical protein
MFNDRRKTGKKTSEPEIRRAGHQMSSVSVYIISGGRVLMQPPALTAINKKQSRIRKKT